MACGTGDLCRDLAAAGYDPIGVDLSAGMLAHARTAAPLVHGDALHLPLAPASLDGAVSGFALRNFVALPPLFAELARVVRPGGGSPCSTWRPPPHPVLRAGHAVYFGHVVPRIGALLSDRDAYRYLPKSVAYLPAGRRLLASLAGRPASTRSAPPAFGGITQLITATRGSGRDCDRVRNRTVRASSW